VTQPTERRGVVLAPGATSAQLLHALLVRARELFPDEFASFTPPADAAICRARIAELIPHLEALRTGSERRSEIARALCLEAIAQLCFVDSRGERPLSEALREESAPLPLARIDLPGRGQLVPCVEHLGKLYERAELATLAALLREQHFATQSAADALIDVSRRAEHDGLSLRGQRFVLIGAGAELSPVYHLLQAGAEVLWLDLQNPPADHLLEPRLAGALHYVDGGVDLLTQPAAVRATIERFAEEGAPVHLGLYAFAPGDARELRLDLTFLALVQSLDARRLASVLLLLSPTSASPVSSEDAELADERRKAASAVQRALLRTGPLAPGHVEVAGGRVACAVVAQQGVSYQVGEYVAKRLGAEALFEYGNTLSDAAPGALTVSVQMAPISTTRSLAGPLLDAAIMGAKGLRILIASAASARDVSALLTLHDLLTDDRAASRLAALPRTERLARLFGSQVHGGIYAQPFALEGLIRLAALRGITQRPRLALEFLR
jgi:hypothetical protein